MHKRGEPGMGCSGAVKGGWQKSIPPSIRKRVGAEAGREVAEVLMPLHSWNTVLRNRNPLRYFNNTDPSGQVIPGALTLSGAFVQKWPDLATLGEDATMLALF